MTAKLRESDISRPVAAPGATRRMPWRALALPLTALPLLGFLVLPLVALLGRLNLDVLSAQLLSPAVGQTIRLSMMTTLATTLITLLLGTPLAFLLARTQFWGRQAVDTLLDLPMVLPPSVAGIALLIAFGRRGLFGPLLTSLELEIAFTQTAVVMAQLFVAAPFYVKAAAAGFAGVDRELEQSAALDGATRLGGLRYITIPLAWPALFGGMIMTWARALGEFGATIIFAGNFPGRTQTMPLAIYLGFERDLDLALTLAAILLAISFAVLLTVKWMLRQRVGAG